MADLLRQEIRHVFRDRGTSNGFEVVSERFSRFIEAEKRISVQFLQELTNEERIAGRLLANGRGERRSRLAIDAERVPDQLRDVGPAERADLDGFDRHRA